MVGSNGTLDHWPKGPRCRPKRQCAMDALLLVFDTKSSQSPDAERVKFWQGVNMT